MGHFFTFQFCDIFFLLLALPWKIRRVFFRMSYVLSEMPRRFGRRSAPSRFGKREPSRFGKREPQRSDSHFTLAHFVGLASKLDRKSVDSRVEFGFGLAGTIIPCFL